MRVNGFAQAVHTADTSHPHHVNNMCVVRLPACMRASAIHTLETPTSPPHDEPLYPQLKILANIFSRVSQTLRRA
ncbi:hypothetical protein F7P83_08130 [Brevibacterium luteolum]|nr:hypothetical protein [Brevibacterium luteolum]